MSDDTKVTIGFHSYSEIDHYKDRDVVTVYSSWCPPTIPAVFTSDMFLRIYNVSHNCGNYNPNRPKGKGPCLCHYCILGRVEVTP